MKKVELTTAAILLPLDYCVIILAGLLAYALRFSENLGINQLPPALYQIPFSRYVGLLAITALVWVIIFFWNGLYAIKGNRRIVEEIKKVFFACATGVMLIIVATFFERDLFSSRFIILSGFAFAVIGVIAVRIIVIYIERSLFRHGIGVQRVVMIGNGHITQVVKDEMELKKTLGYLVVQTFPVWSQEVQEKIVALAETNKIDQCILTDPSVTREQSEAIMDACDEHHIVFKYAAAVFDAPFANIEVMPIGGIPIVEVKKTPLEGWGRILKRVFDIVGALVLIILTSPIQIAAAMAIMIDSGRPIFFSRRDDGTKVERIGQYGKPFHYFKFRSMKPKTDSLRYTPEFQEKNLRAGSPMVKIEDDPRITGVGKFIRRFSIDELPEFFMVLKGDMSLVGPRPHLPEEVAKYEKHHKKALHMKPGVTGLAQVTGRSDLDFEDEVRLDTFYMEHWALWLDIVILFKTPLALLKKRTAL